ncbi:hydroxyacylglutathione hydrolase [bacterium]|nr:hydroxyacylglutathione hydrolase [bacterium]
MSKRRRLFSNELQNDLHLHVIPGFQDNYFYLLEKPSTGECAAIDPGDASPVQSLISSRGLSLTAIMLTHHHRDHTGGVGFLLNSAPKAPVILCSEWMTIPDAWSAASVERVSTKVNQKQSILGFPLRAIDVRGHTLDHIAFVIGDTENQRQERDVFVGDALFGAGCGGLFEGTYEQMLAALKALRELPGHLRAWCAHEYTLKNLRVAIQLQESNPLQTTRLQRLETERTAEALEPHELMTIPLEMAEEFATNPFLRWDQPELQKAIDTVGDLATFTYVRKFRDRF